MAGVPATLVFVVLGGLSAGGVGADHDPTAPPEAAEPREPAAQADSPATPEVQAILRSGDRRIAFVGDAYIREGDVVPFGRVERIERHAVVFRQNDSLVHVPVQGTGIKRNQRDNQ